MPDDPLMTEFHAVRELIDKTYGIVPSSGRTAILRKIKKLNQKLDETTLAVQRLETLYALATQSVVCLARELRNAHRRKPQKRRKRPLGRLALALFFFLAIFLQSMSAVANDYQKWSPSNHAEFSTVATFSLTILCDRLWWLTGNEFYTEHPIIVATTCAGASISTVIIFATLEHANSQGFNHDDAQGDFIGAGIGGAAGGALLFTW